MRKKSLFILVTIGLLVLVIFALGRFNLFTPEIKAADPPCVNRGGSCEYNTDCCFGFDCEEKSLCCDKNLREDVGTTCYCNEECLSRVCGTDGKCTAPSCYGIGYSCSPDRPCCSPYTCGELGKCCDPALDKSEGSFCNCNAECNSGYCSSDRRCTVAPTCSPRGYSCADLPCCSPYVCGEYEYCCDPALDKSEDSVCYCDDECHYGRCDFGTTYGYCTGVCAEIGASCGADFSCCSPLECGERERCCDPALDKSEDSRCYCNAECNSGNCFGGGIYGYCAVEGICPTGETKPHNECDGTECTSVDSCGVDACMTDSDCLGADGNGGDGGNGEEPSPPLGIRIEIKNPLNATSFEALVDSLINLIFYIALALVPLMIIIAAVYLITAAGDPSKINTAKNIIIYTLIGLAIVLLAKGLISVLGIIIKGG